MEVFPGKKKSDLNSFAVKFKKTEDPQRQIHRTLCINYSKLTFSFSPSKMTNTKGLWIEKYAVFWLVHHIACKVVRHTDQFLSEWVPQRNAEYRFPWKSRQGTVIALLRGACLLLHFHPLYLPERLQNHSHSNFCNEHSTLKCCQRK